MAYIYLASPYSHDDPDVMEGRYRAVLLYTAQIFNDTEYVDPPIFSPIIHCHLLAKALDLPRDMNFWRNYDIDMLLRASKFHVLQLPKWETSVGISFEWGYAQALTLPIEFIHPNPDILAELHSGPEAL